MGSSLGKLEGTLIYCAEPRMGPGVIMIRSERNRENISPFVIREERGPIRGHCVMIVTNEWPGK